jgi:hypothetical protein
LGKNKNLFKRAEQTQIPTILYPDKERISAVSKSLKNRFIHIKEKQNILKVKDLMYQ